MTLDLAALKRVAEAAKKQFDNGWPVVWANGKAYLYRALGVQACDYRIMEGNLADFHSKMNPDTALALIARAEQADALKAERDAARRWAQAWKWKAKETRWWERDMRESAIYWANEESDRLGQLLSAEAERVRLKAQNERLSELLRVAATGLEHGPSCDVLRNRPCNCGLEYELAGIRAALAAQERE